MNTSTFGASEIASEIDQKSEDQLGHKLYQYLFGRRYLIVLDNIWSVECWDKLKFFFPDNGNGSRIVVTTRLSNVATLFSSSSLRMNFLDGDKSWDLLRKTAFSQEDCPLELEYIGKKIVEKCKGLPLSIAVVRGVLAKSSRAKEYWENVLRDINSILKSDDDEDHCLDLLSLSYTHLPVHLKPCFIYMGILKENERIDVSRSTPQTNFLQVNSLRVLTTVERDPLETVFQQVNLRTFFTNFMKVQEPCFLHHIPTVEYANIDHQRRNWTNSSIT